VPGTTEGELLGGRPNHRRKVGGRHKAYLIADVPGAKPAFAFEP
jgi:hypothetical protein